MTVSSEKFIDSISMPSSQRLMSQLSKKAYNPISQEEERELIKRAQQGDKAARKKLVEVNLRFIAQQASKFATPGTEEWEELIAVGTIGLLKAIERFDLSRNTRLLTFAGRYIHHEIYNEKLKEISPLKLPYTLRRLATLLPKVQNELYKKLDREPTIEEIKEYLEQNHRLKIKKEDIRTLLEKIHVPLSVEALHEMNDNPREDFWTRFYPGNNPEKEDC